MKLKTTLLGAAVPENESSTRKPSSFIVYVRTHFTSSGTGYAPDMSRENLRRSGEQATEEALYSYPFLWAVPPISGRLWYPLCMVQISYRWGLKVFWV